VMAEYGIPSDDEVRRLLVQYQISEGRIHAVRHVLLQWFARRPSEQRILMVPRNLSDRDDPLVLTARDMVTHLERFTDLGRSYVELFIAGGLTNPHVDLEEALAILEES
jgi:hypothetical protein